MIYEDQDPESLEYNDNTPQDDTIENNVENTITDLDLKTYPNESNESDLEPSIELVPLSEQSIELVPLSSENDLLNPLIQNVRQSPLEEDLFQEQMGYLVNYDENNMVNYTDEDLKDENSKNLVEKIDHPSRPFYLALLIIISVVSLGIFSIFSYFPRFEQ